MTMAKEYWTLEEVMEIFHMEEGILRDLEEEEIICPLCQQGPSEKVFPLSEVEKLRLAKLLMDEMEVNLSWVEIILRMRQGMIDMRRQFDAILEDIARQMHEALQTRL
jgi:MerR family transcriptional regulator, heat shock protein HspR